MTTKAKNQLSYKDAGVDISAGNALVEHIKPLAQRTRRPEVLAGIGGFGALCAIPKGYQEPILVSSTDGVGTKLRLAMELNKHDSIGIDLVAMCVNDIIVTGAEPLLFLDYYATGRLDVSIASQVIKGIAHGCELAGAALVGGETAEMPGMYQGEDYDLAGFCVGVVEKSRIIDGSQVKSKDVLIGLTASGPHSNGYSLIRKILELQSTDLTASLQGDTLANLLLTPTRIYVKTLLHLIREYPVHAIAHITGGGLTENLPRVLPKGSKAVINTKAWEWPAIFKWLQTQGNVATAEMYRTFNCGIGMVICVAEENASAILSLLKEVDEPALVIGHIAASSEKNPHVEFISE